MKFKNQVWAGRIAIFVVIVAAIVGIYPWGPNLFTPANALELLPFYIIAIPLEDISTKLPFLAVIPVISLVPFVFFRWCEPVFSGSPELPSRSLVLFVGMAVFSFIWQKASREYGIEYQGRKHVRWVMNISIIWWMLLATLAIVAKRNPSYERNLIYHTTLFVWLAWYSFPWLGEFL